MHSFWVASLAQFYGHELVYFGGFVAVSVAVRMKIERVFANGPFVAHDHLEGMTIEFFASVGAAIVAAGGKGDGSSLDGINACGRLLCPFIEPTRDFEGSTRRNDRDYAAVLIKAEVVAVEQDHVICTIFIQG